MATKRKFDSWSTDKIVVVGLVSMGIVSIIGYIGYAIYSGTLTGTEVPMAIVSGLTGYLGGRNSHEINSVR